MKALIEVTIVSSAFDDQSATELARILRKLVDAIEVGHIDLNLRDLDGNDVGKFTIVS